jgi:vacuolar protein sorting-associated protein 51
MATISTQRTQSPAPQRVQSPPITQSPAGTPSSSVRPSLDIPQVDGRPTSPAPANASQRRNRVALRDYYNLKSKNSPLPNLSRTASITSTTSNGTTSTLTALDDGAISSTFRSQLDEENFDADVYIEDLLKTSNLRTILKAEGSLVSEIKNLDGERKALVYDNYSKLITATQTIGTMRKSMDEAGEGSLRSISMLGPAVDGVANSAAELSRGSGSHDTALAREQKDSRQQERSKRETVKWVLGTPARLQRSVDRGQREGAEADWKEIQLLLEAWGGVKGSAELKAACEGIMSQPSPEEIPNGGRNCENL